MTKLNLLGKRELWISGIALRNVNLSTVADVVAKVLGLERGEVIVTDAGEDHMVVDIVRENVNAEQIFGKRQELLDGLSKVPGLTVTKSTDFHSEGALGFISLNKDVARRLIQDSMKMSEEIKEKIRRRCIVYPTGYELIKGYVQDTNTPLIADALKRRGYTVDVGHTIDEDENLVASKILEAVDSGYGLVVLTGGVGAEYKDRTVEGVLKVDALASTPYVVKYKVGTGRHLKDGVRIAVGKIGETVIVALPGPTDEVKLALEPLAQGLSLRFDKSALANRIAEALREEMRSKMTKTQ
jgi:molybdenum cofactor synthesis domain-containing protein